MNVIVIAIVILDMIVIAVVVIDDVVIGDVVVIVVVIIRYIPSCKLRIAKPQGLFLYEQTHGKGSKASV